MGMRLAQPLVIAAVALLLSSALAFCGTGGPGNSSHTKQLWRPTSHILNPPPPQGRRGNSGTTDSGATGNSGTTSNPNKSEAIVK